ERGSLVVPALANVGTLRRLANCVQIQSPCQLFEVVVIVAHGRAGLQPFRLPLRTPRRKINLDEFYRAGHQGIRCESLLYDARAARAGYRTEVTLNRREMALNSRIRGRKLTHANSLVIPPPC